MLRSFRWASELYLSAWGGTQAEKPHGTKLGTHTVEGLLRVIQLTILLDLLGKRRPRAAQAPAQSHRSQGPI